MPKQTKTCRVCGEVYEACNSARAGGSVFNWREVACSPECGMVYLDRVTAARSVEEPVEMPVVEVWQLSTVEDSERNAEVEFIFDDAEDEEDEDA